MTIIRTRWAAIGAAVAVTLGAGGLGLAGATSPSDAVTFVPITPCRVIDTRSNPDFNVGSKTSPLGPGETHTISAHGDNGNCTGIPASATGVSLNVTAVGATAPTFLTIWAHGEAQPEASSLNPAPGQAPAPNAVASGLSSDGEFNVYNAFGNVDVIADINGYYTDHHHDDRYYTESEVDAAVAAAIAAQTWSESMPISAAWFYDGSSNPTWTIASGGSDAWDGLTLHDTGYGRFFHGFTLPPQYQAGSDVKIRISWMADIDNTPGCTFRLEDNGTGAMRPGQTKIGLETRFVGGPDVGGGSFPYVILEATNEGSPTSFTDNVLQSAELILPGAALEPGDQIETAIARRSAPTPTSQDSCTGGLTILGLTAEPA